MKIPRCNDWMFRFVKCKSYMKKVNDGRRIVRYPESGSIDSCEYYYGWDDKENKDIVKEVEDYDGALDFLKTYYERKDKEFVGIVVGMKMVRVTAYLYADTECDWRGHEYIRIGRQDKEVVKCALVYYGCNKSRLVPMGDMEIMQEA